MDLTIAPELERYRRDVAAFVERELLPLEAERANYDEHENIRLDVLERVRERARAVGVWAPQVSREHGGMGLGVVAMAVLYEEMARSIFGPVTFNCAAPDDGNMMLLAKVARPDQQQRWLHPIVAGRVRSAFAMTEPDVASSDPANLRTRAERVEGGWRITGTKWFITGAAEARHFIVVARTSDDPRHGLTTFLFNADAPGWRIVRRIPIMGPEEHGGHCELAFEGLVVPDADVLGEVGAGLKMTQIRLGPARLTHCMRWLGMAKRALEIGVAAAQGRTSFGTPILEHESVANMIGDAATQIEVGRLLVMQAAWKLDRGERARVDISMAKVHVADALHRAIDVAIQMCGARGYSKDLVLEWMYRYARQARLVDGASEVHRGVIAAAFAAEGAAMWSWRPAS